MSENQLLYFWAPEKLWDDPDCLIDIQNTPTQCAWVGHMQIIYFGLQFDLYSTPVAPEKDLVYSKTASLDPLEASDSSEWQDLVTIATR